MANPDQAFEALKKVMEDFKVFCANHGAISESDTRANLIDRILVEVCAWPTGQIKREPRVDSGFIDYSLVLRGRPYVAVEAKKEGVHFELPIDQHQRTYKLTGTLLTSVDLKKAVEQVRTYCVDEGIRYAIATNGYAWVVFRAIREDKPWREGHAIVFQSLEAVAQHFTEFWNLFSFEAIESGILDDKLGSTLRVERQLFRPITFLHDADLPLQRNRLHAQLHPFIKKIFEDIAGQEQIEILQNCYVHELSLNIVADDLGFVISDSIPRFLKNEGTEEIKQQKGNAGSFGKFFDNSAQFDKGHLCLLLGGIGSGKSTFLRRYQRTIGKPLLEKHCLWFNVNFLEAPQNLEALEGFVWNSILDQLRARYKSEKIEVRKNIKKAYADKISPLNETALKHFNPSDENYEKALTPHLEEWQKNTNEYVPRLLSLCKPSNNTKVVIFVDNVDQLAPAHQAQIFLLSQRITRRTNSITIVALREESYYTASVQKSFTAYTNQKFHIASPKFLELIRSRINYALNIIQQTEQLELMMASNIPLNKNDLADYLQIVESSLFDHNRNIVRFIESICFGNMRLALEMFTTFLASGATDVDKMLRIYRKSGYYSVAYHEFVKSIMLGDRQYYKESHSSVMNLFDCGLEKNSSHFTALRVLRVLLARSGESTIEGQGYVEISKIVALFEDLYDNREDLIRNMNRLVYRQLIEVNTRSTETISGASHARITSSGWFYLTKLFKQFSYLDLVLQDTPFNEKQTAQGFTYSLISVNNMYDRDDEKMPRMSARFNRVEQFINYLEAEEKIESQRYSLSHVKCVTAVSNVAEMRDQFLLQKNWIANRLQENRERYQDEASDRITETDKAYFASIRNDLEKLIQS